MSAALDYARLPEPFSSKAVLDLHDAVELFLQLVAEHLGATLSKKGDFLEYWPAINEKLGTDLPMQPAMKRLNQARVGLKHSGIRPSRDVQPQYKRVCGSACKRDARNVRTP